MIVLITGASSFIGINLIKELIKTDYDVYATYNHEYNYVNESKGGKIKFIKVDLCSPLDFLKLPIKVDVLIHLAAISDYRGVSNSILANSNITGTNNLLEYAKFAQVKKVIYTSSISVYGSTAENILSAETPIISPNYYGLSKYSGEIALQSYVNAFSSISIRLPGVLGNKSGKSFLPFICNRIVCNDTAEIYNPQSLFNNAIYVEDLCLFILKLLNSTWSGFHAFPVGARNSEPLINLVNKMKNMLKSTSKITILESLKKSYTIDSTYAQNMFKYIPSDITEICIRHCNGLIN